MIEENVKYRKKLQNSIDVNVSRSFFNVLVSGHRPSRLPKDEGNQQKIKKTLQDILDCIHQNCQANKKTLRILSGNSEGVDQWTYTLNNEFFKVPFYRIATFHNDSSEHCSYVHNIYIADPPSRSESENPSSNSLPETWVKATDEIKLDYADLMIAVWDGNYPQGSMGGVVRLLIEALKRHIPVVLVDASSEALGTILLSQTNMINSSQHYRLKIEEKHLAWVKQELFQKKTLEEFEKFFCLKLKNENRLLMDLYKKAKSYDPMEKPVFYGILHATFTGSFREKWKHFHSPIQAYRGKQESSLEKTLPNEFWQYFDMFDRVATHAANKYRDKVVSIHLLSSVAVFGAVAGSIVQSDFFEILWGLLELISLIGILLLLRERRQKMNSHDVWLSFREAAEAFRINVFLRSQLSSLPQIHENIWSEERGIQKSESPSSQKQPLSPKKIRLADPSLWVITQLFHEAGPPNGSKDYILTKNRQELIAQMKELIEDQKGYHERNQEKNLRVHEKIEKITVGAFVFISVVVTLHLLGSVIHSWPGERPSIALSDTIRLIHNPYTIFFTAFLPALFAALHDIHSQLELNRVAKNSQQMSESLGTSLTTLDTIKDEEDPMALRNLARELAQTLYQEHDAWGKLMKDQRLDVPA